MPMQAILVSMLFDDKMEVIVDARYTKEYLEADKRSIANAVQIFYKDGTKSEKVEIEYPIGHKRRRVEGIPLLISKIQTQPRRKTRPQTVCNHRKKYVKIKPI